MGGDRESTDADEPWNAFHIKLHMWETAAQKSFFEEFCAAKHSQCRSLTPSFF